MNASHLRPVSQLVGRYGVKMLAYGGPGEGKTPAIATAPNPVLLLCEPGALSIRNLNIPTWQGYDIKSIEEFFKWIMANPADLKKFDTICIDSLSQLCETSLSAAQHGPNRDGRAHYGIMSKQVMEWVDHLFFMAEKHVYLICKQGTREEVSVSLNAMGMPVETTKRQVMPFFPGQDLPVKIPHRYDEILHFEKALIPGAGMQTAIRTRGTDAIMARDRSGKLAEFEPPHLGNIIAKCMS